MAVHQLCVHDGNGGDVVRVHAHHLLLVLLVRDDIVDGHLGGGAGGGGQGDDRHGLVLRVRRAFQRHDVGKFRVIGDDAYGLGRVHGRAAADGQDEVRAGLGVCLHARLDVADGGVGLDFSEQLVGDTRLAQDVQHLVRHAEFHQILVRGHESLVQSQALHFLGQHLACPGSEVGYFVQYESVDHDNGIIIVDKGQVDEATRSCERQDDKS